MDGINILADAFQIIRTVFYVLHRKRHIHVLQHLIEMRQYIGYRVFITQRGKSVYTVHKLTGRFRMKVIQFHEFQKYIVEIFIIRKDVDQFHF